MKKFFIMGLIGVASIALLQAQESWGTKADITNTNTVTHTIPIYATHLSLYNAGSTDLAVEVNGTTAAIFEGRITSNTVSLVPGTQTLTIDYSERSGRSGQLNKISKVFLRSVTGTNSVYITAY